MSRSVVAVTTLFAFLLTLWWPGGARADAPPAAAPPAGQPAGVGDEAMAQAKTHFEAGKAAYNAGDYKAAIREFKAAEALRPSPVLAYNIGNANANLGRKRVAVKYLRRYLEQMPNAANRAEVEGHIAQLERDLAAEPPPPPPNPNGPPPPGAEQPSDMPPPPEANAPAQPGYDPYATTASGAPPPTPPKKKSYWWVWLIVAGGVTLLVGITVYAVLAAQSTTTTVADHGLIGNAAVQGARPMLINPRMPEPDRTLPTGLTLRF